jgi:hypothetical protein
MSTKPRTPESSNRGHSSQSGFFAHGQAYRYSRHLVPTWRTLPPQIPMMRTGLPDLLVDLFKELPSRSSKPLPAKRAWRHQDLCISAICDGHTDAVEVRLHSEGDIVEICG